MNSMNNMLRRASALTFACVTALSGAAGGFSASAEGYGEKTAIVQTMGSSKKTAKTKVTSKTKTVDNKYYRISKNSYLYKKTSKGVKKTKEKPAKSFFAAAKPARANGNILRVGQKESTASYVKLGSGTYEGYYIKISEAVEWENEVYAMRRIVTDYGRSMKGGRYVFGAAGYRCTDCSGLIMQCYDQIGVDMAHSTYSQAKAGKAVKLKNAKPGDIIVLNYRSHVALYLGDGKMVHALNSRDGIKIEPISKLKYYHLDGVRRII